MNNPFVLICRYMECRCGCKVQRDQISHCILAKLWSWGLLLKRKFKRNKSFSNCNRHLYRNTLKRTVLRSCVADRLLINVWFIFMFLILNSGSLLNSLKCFFLTNEPSWKCVNHKNQQHNLDLERFSLIVLQCRIDSLIFTDMTVTVLFSSGWGSVTPGVHTWLQSAPVFSYGCYFCSFFPSPMGRTQLEKDRMKSEPALIQTICSDTRWFVTNVHIHLQWNGLSFWQRSNPLNVITIWSTASPHYKFKGIYSSSLCVKFRMEPWIQKACFRVDVNCYRQKFILKEKKQTVQISSVSFCTFASY